MRLSNNFPTTSSVCSYRLRTFAATITAVAILFAGCTDGSNADDPDTTENADGDSQDKLTQSVNAENGFNENIADTAALVDPFAISVLRYEADESDMQLFFEMGPQSCYGIDTAVEESDEEVTLRMQSGLLPGVVEEDCEIGVYPYQTSVTLDQPVGDRLVTSVDGTGTARPIGADIMVQEVVTDANGKPDPSQFEGLTIDEAIDLADGNSVSWAVIRIDGEPKEANVDPDADVSLVTENDVVVEALAEAGS